jgi:hypothetical protein
VSYREAERRAIEAALAASGGRLLRGGRRRRGARAEADHAPEQDEAAWYTEGPAGRVLRRKRRELRPVQHVAERALYLDVPVRGDSPDTRSETCSGDGPQRVQVRDARLREPLALAERDLLWDAAYGGRHLDHKHTGQIHKRGRTAKKNHGTAANRIRQGHPPDVELTGLLRIGRMLHTALFVLPLRRPAFFGGLARPL